MELVQDVVGVIVSFLGYKASLLDKKYRDQYFKEHGIWIHVFQFNAGGIQIPPKFYEYDLNLNIRRNIHLTFGNAELMRIFANYPKLLQNFPKKLKTLKNVTYVIPENFRNFKILKKSELSLLQYPIDELVNRDLSDHIFTITTMDRLSSEAMISAYVERFNLIKDKDCRFNLIHSYVLSEEHIELIREKLLVCPNSCLNYRKKYPNLQRIIWDENRDASDFNPSNFPKLRKIELIAEPSIDFLEKGFNVEVFDCYFVYPEEPAYNYNAKKNRIHAVHVRHNHLCEMQDHQVSLLPLTNRTWTELLEDYEKYGKSKMVLVYHHVKNVDKILFTRILETFDLVFDFSCKLASIPDLLLLLSEIKITETKIIKVTGVKKTFTDFSSLVEIYKKNNIFIKISKYDILVSCPEYMEIRRQLKLSTKNKKNDLFLL